MFIGYLSSFFIALLLSLFYLGYAASDVFTQIKKEIAKEIETEVREKIPDTVSPDKFFIFDYVADISEPGRQSVFSSGFAVYIPVIDEGIPLRKICLSEYFLRPPPAAL
jgi:hypothetical protein